ncbi:hypothetical protein A5M85_05105 [Cellulophaga lytica]|uniref:SMI1/KNR4 family protein n=1 Tax=Cellulophaga lytica TaxID=979 RepID=UPI000950B1AF|nr:SMI1/KNR4 family protein [Cellulophaga lytica]APU09682.1 hypothetical protein A5M85_05105 [Cellulophaga lytica]
MRKFTISKRFHKSEYKLLEERIGSDLPNELFQVLEIYAGCYIEERIYFDKKNNKWVMANFLKFAQIFNYFEDIEEELGFAELDIKLLAFAGEEGGWRFCISTEEAYPVYIFKSSDYAGKDAFEKISSSITEFLNGLQLPNKKEN